MGLDVVSSHELGRNGLPDREQLRWAGAEGRCLVTINRDDFVALTVHFAEAGEPHAGVLIVPRSLPAHDFARIAHALLAYARRNPNRLHAYTIDYLSH